jgi:hypothetical protein
MEKRVSVQGIPVGGVHIVRQSVATVPLTFHAGQNGLAIAVASVVKEQRSLNCSTKAERPLLRPADLTHWQNNDETATAPGIHSTLSHKEETTMKSKAIAATLGGSLFF